MCIIHVSLIEYSATKYIDEKYFQAKAFEWIDCDDNLNNWKMLISFNSKLNSLLLRNTAFTHDM